MCILEIIYYYNIFNVFTVDAFLEWNMILKMVRYTT